MSGNFMRRLLVFGSFFVSGNCFSPLPIHAAPLAGAVVAPWLEPLEAPLKRAPQSQNELLTLLAGKAGEKAVPAAPTFPAAEVGAWAAARFDKLSQLPESDPQRERLT